MTDTPDTVEAPKAPTPPARRRAPRKTSAPKASAPKTAAKKSTPAAAKAKRAPAAAAKPATRRAPATKKAAAAPTKSRLGKATEKVGGKWGAAAIAGGVAAIGAAATAALLSLRGSSANKGVHTPDGKDASTSFKAGIADENGIPEKG